MLFSYSISLVLKIIDLLSKFFDCIGQGLNLTLLFLAFVLQMRQRNLKFGVQILRISFKLRDGKTKVFRLGIPLCNNLEKDQRR